MAKSTRLSAAAAAAAAAIANKSGETLPVSAANVVANDKPSNNKPPAFVQAEYDALLATAVDAAGDVFTKESLAMYVGAGDALRGAIDYRFARTVGADSKTVEATIDAFDSAIATEWHAETGSVAHGDNFARISAFVEFALACGIGADLVNRMPYRRALKMFPVVIFWDKAHNRFIPRSGAIGAILLLIPENVPTKGKRPNMKPDVFAEKLVDAATAMLTDEKIEGKGALTLWHANNTKDKGQGKGKGKSKDKGKVKLSALTTETAVKLGNIIFSDMPNAVSKRRAVDASVSLIQTILPKLAAMNANKSLAKIREALESALAAPREDKGKGKGKGKR